MTPGRLTSKDHFGQEKQPAFVGESPLCDSASPETKSRRRRRYQYGSVVREHRKRGPDVWGFRWSDGKGRPKQIVGTLEEYPTKSEAKKACENLRVIANSERPRQNVTLHGICYRYIEQVLKPCYVPLGGVRDEQSVMGDSCARDYRTRIDKYIVQRWGDYHLTDFTRPEVLIEVENWFKLLIRTEKNPVGLAPSYVTGIYSVMVQIFKYAIKWGYFIGENPMIRVELPRGHTKRLTCARQLTPAQFLALLPSLPVSGGVKAAVMFTGWLGTRPEETFGLQWKDLNPLEKLVSLRQGVARGRINPLLKTTGSRTTMPVPADVVKALLEWRSITPYASEDDWVFASASRGGKMPVDAKYMFCHIIRPLAVKAGLPSDITWYSLRHSLNGWCKECISREDRKILLRHESDKVNEGYGEPGLDRKREIQEAVVQYVKDRASGEPRASSGKKQPRHASDRKKLRLAGAPR